MTQDNTPQNYPPTSGEEYYPRAAPIMVWVTLILFLGMMTLLGYRWFTMGEPNGFILVKGDKDDSGTQIMVSDSLDQPLSHGELTYMNNYQLRIPLPQGTYHIQITHGDNTILKQPVSLREGTGVVYNLDQATTTKPSE